MVYIDQRNNKHGSNKIFGYVIRVDGKIKDHCLLHSFDFLHVIFKPDTIELLRNLVHSLLGIFGYHLKHSSDLIPIDLRAICNHPVSLFYHSLPRPILVDLPVSLGRSLRTFPLQAGHPFIFAMSKAINNRGNEKMVIRSAFDSYYKAVQPHCAADWLNLNADQSRILTQEPPHSLTMPWDKRIPAGWRVAREAFAKNENNFYGTSLSIDNGWHFWGPVCPVKLTIETDRLHRLLKSFAMVGYKRDDGPDGDIAAVVLKKADGSWRWQVTGGEHRVAAVGAFGYEQVPVRVKQVINREDVDVWPGVQSGFFTTEAALSVFDMIFDGVLPRIAVEWAKSNCNVQTEAASGLME